MQNGDQNQIEKAYVVAKNVKVFRALGRLRRSATFEHATGGELDHGRACQRFDLVYIYYYILRNTKQIKQRFKLQL